MEAEKNKPEPKPENIQKYQFFQLTKINLWSFFLKKKQLALAKLQVTRQNRKCIGNRAQEPLSKVHLWGLSLDAKIHCRYFSLFFSPYFAGAPSLNHCRLFNIIFSNFVQKQMIKAVPRSAVGFSCPFEQCKPSAQADFQSMELPNIYSMFTFKSAQGNTHLLPS